jgi:serine phosphatase RsbU (regulator of sigma subunit)
MPDGVSLKVVVAVTYIALVTACSGAIAFFTYSANSKLILDIASDSFAKTGQATIDNTQYLLQPVSAAVDSMATLFDGDENFISRPDLMRLLFEMVRLYPQIYSAYVSAESDGRFVQVQRIDPNAKTWGPDSYQLPPGSRYALRRVDGAGGDRVDAYHYVEAWGKVVGSNTVGHATYDPRGRPFYVAALASAGHVLTDSYIFASNGKPGVTIARRLEMNGVRLGAVAVDITLDSLSKFLTAQPVGAHGIALIIDRDGYIIAAPDPAAVRLGADRAKTIKDLDRSEVTAAWVHYQVMQESLFTYEQDGVDYIAAFRLFPRDFGKDWMIMEAAPVDDFVGGLKVTMRQIALLSLGIACFGGIGSLVIAGQITKPIETLTEEADRIRSLTLSGVIGTTSRILEIRHLIESMDAMKAAIRTLAGDDADQSTVTQLIQRADAQSPYTKLFRRVIDAVETRRARETELELAAQIQNSVLPDANEESSDRPVQIAAKMRAAREIGGDFYDWIWRDDGQLAFVIGDVAGKGVPAAMFMSSTRTAVRAMLMSGSSLLETVEGANRLLAEKNEKCFFVTLFIGELDLVEGRLTYINAGHEPAQVFHAHGETAELEPTGPALGVADPMEFDAAETVLKPGDMVILLTDGVTDAVNAAGERFGVERLRTTLSSEIADSSGAVDRIIAAVDAFVGAEAQFDDITCLALRYRPHGASNCAAEAAFEAARLGT